MTKKEIYTIWIVCPAPEDMPVALCFVEIADALQEAFHFLGYECSITYDVQEVRGTAIVLAARLLHRIKDTLPNSIIIYNLEQLHDQMQLNSSIDAYMKNLRQYRVWDYSQRNRDYLEKMGCTVEAILPLGYSPCLTRIKNITNQDVDVLFYGTPHPRRTKIINELKSKGLNVVALHKVYGAERDAWIARSKVVINIHMQAANILEVARISYLLANRKCVVSEIGDDHSIEAPYQSAVAFCEYDALVDKCIELVNDEKLREAYEQAAFQAITAMPQHQFLENILKSQLKSTIFIALPSYLDAQCVTTILRIFESAKYPENLTVGVCWQTNKELGAFPWKALGKWADQVRVVEYDVSEAKGANWARHQAGLLYENQQYYLLMDAHMHMVDAWDHYLLSEYALVGEEEAVLTYYCAPFTPPALLTPPNNRNRRVVVDRFGSDGDPQLLHLNRHIIDKNDFRCDILYPSPFIVHHFIFTKASVFQRIPIDPEIHFWGDETTLSARLWTHGINVYQLPRLPAFHQWDQRQKSGGREYLKITSKENKNSYAHVVRLMNADEDRKTQAVSAEYRLGKNRSIDDLWKFAGVNPKENFISDAARTGAWNLEVKYQQSPKSFPTIFVSIACYRDSECQYTIRDLFEKALYPDRVFVGVCWQIDKAADKHCFEIEYKRGNQVREVFFDWREAEGVCWARTKSHALMQGEDYIFQIDCHSRFTKGWDEQFIQMHQRLNDPKAVFSSAPAKYTPPNNLEEKTLPTVLRANPFLKSGTLRFASAKLTKPPTYPLRGMFIAAGCLFAKRAMLEQVPYDPELYFDHEEVAYALRLYTHGWNVYSPSKQLIYHFYAKVRQEGKPTHWNDLMDSGKNKAYSRLAGRAAERFVCLVGVRASLSAETVMHFSRYGLGEVRTLAEFEHETGIDFKNKTVSERGLRAEFIENIEQFLPGKMFVPALDGASKPNANNPLQKQLVAEKNSANMSPSTSTNAPPMTSESGTSSILVCISTASAESLAISLKSVFTQAKNKANISVSIAWTGVQPYALPESLAAYKAKIVVRHVSAASVGNALAEAIASWKQQPNIMSVRAGVEFTNDWDVQLSEALSYVDDNAILTQIASTTSREDNTLPALIGIVPKLIDGEWMVAPIASTHTIGGSKKELVATPLVSFDFLAARASVWMRILPDPYMSQVYEDIVYAARLWTHGVRAYLPPASIIRHTSEVSIASPTVTNNQAYIRAQHMLGISYSDQEVALFDLDKYGHGDRHDVEGFWQIIGVDMALKRMHPLAAMGNWQALQKLTKVKRAKEMKEFTALATKTIATNSEHSKLKIFVQIASYRDKECQYTVKDLFEKAAYPDRITVGICWQSIPEEDEECFRVVTRPAQVRCIHFNAKESKGACWARYHTQTLWQNEEFTLQIDSHMRFVERWDELLLSMFESLQNPKAVLTTYPAGFTPPNDFKPKAAHLLTAKGFNADGIFTMNSKRINTSQHTIPVAGAFISGCFLFGPASIIHDVPYDPYLYFFGEEISLSVRLWTHGYDIYHPHKHIAWHDWKRANRKATHFTDHKNWTILNKKSFARVRYMLGGEIPTDAKIKEYVIQEIERYGLGSVRSLHAYENFSGVNFQRRTFEKHSADGVFIESRQHMGGGVPPSANLIKSVANKSQNSTDEVEPFINPKAPLVMPKKARLELSPEQLLRNHGAIKTYESKEVIVYDDFLPEETYQQLYQFALNSDYKHINTTGNVARVWNIDNGFPLRSSWNHYYEAMNQQKHPKESLYPLKKPTDKFIEHINALAPEVGHLIGMPAVNWAHYSVTSWLYPPNTGLSLHNDGSGVYTGAYVYFMNPEWRLHWGGLLMVMDGTANEAIEKHKKEHNANKFTRAKWLHESEHNDYAMEAGFARTIFPKRNRIVFIAPDAYHIVTKVLPTAGDNVRMTLAGFFNRGVLTK
jgi:GT2 family glycosyltransferase/Rps23 Pro-64 3,4-dihydroxylase Tpa1-like proline 4-hydroxylase